MTRTIGASYVASLDTIQVPSYNTYRYALALDAVHDSEGRAQIREPRGAQLANLLAEVAF